MSPSGSVRFWLLTQGRVVLPMLIAAAAALALLGGGAVAADPPPDMVEVVDQRTANSKTFKRRDGSTTKRVYAGNVHYREAGHWKAIDPTLIPAAAAEQGKGFGWRMKSNGFNVLAKRKLEDGYLRTDVLGRQLQFSLRGAQPVAAAVRGSHIAYADALTDVDLRYVVHPEGVKEQLLLKSKDAPSRFTFELDAPAGTNLRAEELPSGDWAFRERRGGRPLFILTDAYATDEPLTRSRPGAATRRQGRDRADHATMNVEKTDDGFAIELAVDEDWLRAEGRKFPVTLDPTLVLQPTTKSAEFDASCGACEGWDYWALYIGTDDSGSKYRSGFQFDLSSIPPSANVTNAKLGLFNPSDSCVWTSKDCGADSHVLNVHEMTKAWTPDVTTWSQVGWNTTSLASYTLPAGAGDNWMDWDVTATAKGWIAGTKANYGVLVRRSTETIDMGGPEVPGGAWDGDPVQRPRLDVTYTSDAPRFHEPETLYGNGADLRWDRFDGSTGNAFSAYEVHRSATAGFTPSDATRIATIRDVNVTAFRDTTAAPSSTFTYKIVVNGSASAQRTVTLPADGQARKVLQPDAARGKATYIDNAEGASTCSNYGAETYAYVGNDGWTERTLLGFDLRDIPAGATVTSATMSAYMSEPPYAGITVGAHRVTAGWDEGTGNWDCTHDGASWAEPWRPTGTCSPWTAAAARPLRGGGPPRAPPAARARGPRAAAARAAARPGPCSRAGS